MSDISICSGDFSLNSKGVSLFPLIDGSSSISMSSFLLKWDFFLFTTHSSTFEDGGLLSSKLFVDFDVFILLEDTSLEQEGFEDLFGESEVEDTFLFFSPDVLDLLSLLIGLWSFESVFFDSTLALRTGIGSNSSPLLGRFLGPKK